MAPSRAASSRSTPDAASSGWSSSLRPPLDLKPALLPEDADDDDDRAVAELLDAALEGDLARSKSKLLRSVPRSRFARVWGLDLTVGWGFVCIGAELAKQLMSKVGMSVDEAVAAAAVGVTGIKRRGPLHLAAANGKVEVCKFLIRSCEVDVDAADADGATPLILAVQGVGSTTTLKILLSRGADPNKADSIGVTPLHIAAERGSYEVAEQLLSKEAEVDPICENGGAPIHVSAENGHAKVLKLLLQHKADYNRHSRSFNTPLAASLIGPSLECLEILIEAGAEVNAGSPLTPLVIAAGKGLTNCVKCLLKAGADANIPDEDGKFLIMLAAAHEHRELVEILFPRTKPVPFMCDWSVDGIIRTMKYPHLEPLELVEEKIADSKSQGKEAFAKGDYLAAIYFYDLAMGKDPLNATLFSNRSLCWLRLREGEMALLDAWHCKMLSPRFAKAWYREGVALSLLKNYKGAADAFKGVLKLDPTNNEIKKAMREAIESLKSAARSGEKNPQAAASV
ncbi:uncharacterized protein [Setaria viridis]|uniref:uncharacterized protein n=1 Tax=Setaria viridis TaxID=4556 RepID=UPI003B3AD78A